LDDTELFIAGGEREKSGSGTDESGSYNKPWHDLLAADKKALESSYQAGLLNKEKANALLREDIKGYVTLLPEYPGISSVATYLEKQNLERADNDRSLEEDVYYLLVQVLNLIFSLAKRGLHLDSVSATDLLLVTDEAKTPTVLCHMINVRKLSSPNYSLTCEKLRMFLIQVTHLCERLKKSSMFKKLEEMIQNSDDQGDLKTIKIILQYLIWGPTQEEVEVIIRAENKRQAFEHWLQLARARMLTQLTSQGIDKLQLHDVAQYLASTSSHELFKINKLLSTY